MASNFEVNISFTMIGPQQPDADFNLAPIFFLHGIAQSKETWKKCLRPIANGTGRRVAVYDARNHGDSGWSRNFTYEDMMKDLENIMQYLQSPKVILIGHCMGGKTAMDFALRNPDKVEKLIVEDMSLRFFPNGEKLFALKYMDLLHESLNHLPYQCKDIASAQKFLATYFHQNMPEELRSDHHAEIDPESLAIEIDPREERVEWKIHLNVVSNAVDNGFQSGPGTGGLRVFKYEGTFDGPALFICGAKSPYKVIEDEKFIQESITKAVFKQVEGAGHLVHSDYPEKFCEEVIQFINEAS